LSQVNLKNFEHLFKEHFKALTGFALKFLPDHDEAKGVVHEVFVLLWEKFDALKADTNHRSYLYTAVRNRCLNVIRDKKKLVQLSTVHNEITDANHDHLEMRELEIEIEQGLNSLPEKCREVFEKSRIEGLKYAEIAEKMNISIKTVEAQMSKALKILRVHLAEFLTLLLLLIFE
jgi:RNA polymerase sigma-70 factor, ECF subfamily